ncbi:MAG: hypothetical protein H7Y60_17905, partial [Rhodospirillaceae bacterium]|nr:hypothetical protein [Rhodospirillales bacterium]
MSTAIPPAPPPAPSSSTGGGAPVGVTVVANAEILAELPDGAMLEAQAVARAAKGMITAMTANGPVQLKANGPLPPIPEGATLLFQVLNKNGEATLRLLAINGRALGGGVLGGPTLGGPVLGGLSLPGGVTMGGLLTPGTGVLGAPQPGLAQPGMAQPDGTAALAGAKVALPGAAAPLGLTATIIRPAMAPGVALAPELGTPAGQPGMLTGGLPPNLPVGTQITVRIAGVGMPPAEAGSTIVSAATPGA